MQRLYTRDEYMRRIEWMKNAQRKIAITTDIIVGFPGETEADFQQTLDLLDEVSTTRCSASNIRSGRTPRRLSMRDVVPEEEKTRRIMIVQERQRAIQIRRNAEAIGAVEEVLVEGSQRSTGQWIGPHIAEQDAELHWSTTEEQLLGAYLPVRVTRAGPNSSSAKRWWHEAGALMRAVMSAGGE